MQKKSCGTGRKPAQGDGLSPSKYRKRSSTVAKYCWQNNQNRKELTVIYHQLIVNNILSFTSQPKAKFYDELLIHLDLSTVPDCRCKKSAELFKTHNNLCCYRYKMRVSQICHRPR